MILLWLLNNRLRNCHISSDIDEILVRCSSKEKDEHDRDKYEFMNNTFDVPVINEMLLTSLKFGVEGGFNSTFYEKLRSTNHLTNNRHMESGNYF